ncbi:hypothetical protein THARTR1_10481 [Trichoderma harzianum]|uniref:Uncharacterized protein n=1 Tax=Trichoderma harzianum TaxID=5544 RepID=A0A2K0TQI5_TRIHA|nr:hypothetical protein THARTR1_10481 [Trichoderma harzianum]
MDDIPTVRLVSIWFRPPLAAVTKTKMYLPRHNQPGAIGRFSQIFFTKLSEILLIVNTNHEGRFASDFREQVN